MLIIRLPDTGSKCLGIRQSLYGFTSASSQSGKNSVALSIGISISTTRVTDISPKEKLNIVTIYFESKIGFIAP